MAFTDRSRAMRVSGDTVLPEFLGQPFYALPEMNAMSPIEQLSAFLLILDRLAGSHGTRTLASPTYAGVVRDQDRQRMARLHAFLH